MDSVAGVQQYELAKYLIGDDLDTSMGNISPVNPEGAKGILFF